MQYVCKECGAPFESRRHAKYCPLHRGIEAKRAKALYQRGRKYCDTCGLVKLRQEFPVNRNGTRSAICSACSDKGFSKVEKNPCEPMGYPIYNPLWGR